MTENELLALWSRSRMHVIASQVAPILLLILTVWLLASGLGQTTLSIRLATAGILLAAGILGTLAQVSAAGEAMAVADDLAALSAPTVVSRRAIASKPWANVVRFVTPAVFVLVYLAILWALFVAPLLQN